MGENGFPFLVGKGSDDAVKRGPNQVVIHKGDEGGAFFDRRAFVDIEFFQSIHDSQFQVIGVPGSDRADSINRFHHGAQFGMGFVGEGTRHLLGELEGCRMTTTRARRERPQCFRIQWIMFSDSKLGVLRRFIA